MRYHPGGDAYIAESKDDFNGWEILAIEDWKPGVKRVHMRRIHPSGRGEFYMVFAKDEYTGGLKINA